MFSNVIVGIDGGPGGLDALAMARRLADEHAEITLAHVRVENPIAIRPESSEFEAAEHERSAELLEDARAAAGISATLDPVRAASVGRGLHELAERVGADLIVVGSSSRGLVGRVLQGDDTRASLNGAPCAVAVAPTHYVDRASALTEIGVGYDESPESKHALAVARELAAQHGARVSAFEAISIPSLQLGGGDGAAVKALEAKVEETRQRIAALGGVEPHAAYGDAAEELALYGASVDLLVIGSRGYGPLGRLMHGGTSFRLTGRARCPLLVLPRAANL
ncbi:MAG: universal stress protein [Solirubrobacteraceae bacterium]